MDKETYDAIVIGAGHNGMALSTYLGKSGWNVLVLERRLEEGGGLSTELYTEPGFLHNLHSNYHTFVGLCPVYDDLDLVGEPDGVTYAHPPVQMGSIFADGTAMTVHTDMAKTHASMSRFSKKDADTFLRLYKEVKGFQDLMIRTLMYAPPIDVNDITKALATWKVEDKTEFFRAKLRSMTINDFLNKHFENEKVKAMLAFHAAVCGYYTDVVGLAVSFPFMLGKIDNWKLCMGGSHRLAHALWRQMRRTQRHPEPGLAGGRDHARRRPGGWGPSRTAGSSVRTSWWPAAWIWTRPSTRCFPQVRAEGDQEDVDRYEYQDGSLFTVHMAMHKIPTYKAAEFDPDINQAWVLNIGYECLEDFNEDWNDDPQGEGSGGPQTERGDQLHVRSNGCTGRKGHRADPGLRALFGRRQGPGGLGHLFQGCVRPEVRRQVARALR